MYFSGSTTYIDQPHWQALHHAGLRLSPQWQEWLLDRGSLTQKLMYHAGGEFELRLLHQSTRRAHPTDYALLALSPQRWALVREVLLCGRGQPWVYARTVIPLTTLRGPLRQLRWLGRRSLGQTLFSNPSAVRETMQLAAIDPGYLPAETGQTEPTWGRRSLFKVGQKSLLVTEVFLHALKVSQNIKKCCHHTSQPMHN